MDGVPPNVSNPSAETSTPLPSDEDNLWKRSKSDASFFLANLTAQSTKDNAQSGNVSEISKVYWDIPEAVEASDTIATSQQFPRNQTFDADGSLEDCGTIRKSETSVKSGASQLHVHHVHFRDGHSRYGQLSTLGEDEFGRRQSSPVAPYPNLVGQLSSSRTDYDNSGRDTTASRALTRSATNKGTVNGAVRPTCATSSSTTTTTSSSRNSTSSRRVTKYQATSNNSTSLASNRTRLSTGSMTTEPRKRSVSPEDTSLLMRIRSTDSFPQPFRHHVSASYPRRWGTEFGGLMNGQLQRTNRAKRQEGVGNRVDFGRNMDDDDDDDMVFSTSLEELKKSLFDQLEKLKSLNSATFMRGQRQYDINKADGKETGITSVDGKSLPQKLNLMDEQCKVLHNCKRLLNEALESPDEGAEFMVRDLFKREGLIGQLLKRLAEPLVDSPVTEDTEKRTRTFIHKSSAASKSASYSTNTLSESLKTTKSTKAMCEATKKNSTTTLDKQSSETLVDGTRSVCEEQSWETMDRQVVIHSAQLLSQILSYENLDSLLHFDLDSAELVVQAQGLSLDEQEQNAPPEGYYQRDVTGLPDEQFTRNAKETQWDLDGTATPTAPSSPTSASNLNALLQRVIRRTWEYREDVDIYRAYMAVIEPLLKQTESICQNVVDSGGLQILVHACRSNDVPTLRHAALALANLALFGGAGSQSEMLRQHAVDWLFRLAFCPDDVIQYFACLTSVVLSTNPKLASSVAASGTLDLVLPFVRTHRPVEFARGQLIAAFSCACMHKQQTQLSGSNSTTTTTGSNREIGRNKHVVNCGKCYAGASKNWLERLLPALDGQRKEARVLAAFHFAVEATLKSDTGQTEIFYATDAVEKLCRLACNLDPMESELAALALHLLGEPVPYRLSPHVPLWTPEDVQCWLDRAGFGKLISKFSELQVDGDLLLRLDDPTLFNDLDVQNGITRLQLLRELNRLKCEADYSALDPSDLAGWLEWAGGLVPAQASGTDLAESMHSSSISSTNTNMSTGAALVPMTTSADLSTSTSASFYHASQVPRWTASTSLVQYTYSLLSAGVDRSFLPMLTDSSLAQDCRVPNAIHRARILSAIRTYLSPRPLDSVSISGDSSVRPLDCFISYRRSNGSALASLLKVHLQLRGYRVFFDIDRLSAGIFKESLFHSIQSSQNFLLVLSPHALDRCLNDVTNTDWIHRELACALKNKCNIIPITYEFDWPDAEKLPEDIRRVTEYNAVNWIHEYQDACIDKVEKFMVKPPSEKVPTNVWHSPLQLQQPQSPRLSPSPCPGLLNPLGDSVQDSQQN